MIEPIRPIYDYDQRTGMVDMATITVGELITDGIIDLAWFAFDAYDEDQRVRLWNKFEAHYYFREIGILPPKRWMMRVIAKLNEVMPKYKPLYQAMEDGTTVMQDGGEYHKRRDVYSTFPQMALGGQDSDYASTGTDTEYETIRDLSLLDVGERIPSYNDVDVMVLEELEPLFLALMSVDIPYL